MTIYKGLLAFMPIAAGPAGYGWTESFYITAPDEGTALVNMESVATARLALLSPGYALSAQRVSIPGNPPDANIVYEYPFTMYGAYVPATGENPPPPENALLLRYSNATFNRAMRLLHGFPLGWTNTPQLSINRVAAYNTALSNYVTLLKAYTQMRVKVSGSSPPAYTFQAIANVTDERVAMKRVGRPFVLFRGRARTR